MLKEVQVFLAALSTLVSACASTTSDAPAADAQATYDAALAERLRADERGMTRYIFVLLRTGPADIDDEAQRKELFRGHFANMGRLADQGKLVLAGPFSDAGDWRGMFVLDVSDIEEARALVAADPTIAAGILVPEFKALYGSAALRIVNETHKKIVKTQR